MSQQCLLLGDVSNVTGASVNTNNNDADTDIDSSVSDVQPTVDNVVMQGINNNYRDIASSHSKLCSYFQITFLMAHTSRI